MGLRDASASKNKSWRFLIGLCMTSLLPIPTFHTQITHLLAHSVKIIFKFNVIYVLFSTTTSRVVPTSWLNYLRPWMMTSTKYTKTPPKSFYVISEQFYFSNKLATNWQPLLFMINLGDIRALSIIRINLHVKKQHDRTLNAWCSWQEAI